MPEQSIAPEVLDSHAAAETKPVLAEEMFAALRTVDHRKNKLENKPLNQRSMETQKLQAKLLIGLDERFVDTVYAHLYSEYLADAKLQQTRRAEAALQGREAVLNEFNDFVAVEGFVNEYLVKKQINLTRPELITSEKDPEKRKRIKAIGNKILDVSHEPDRFGFDWYLDKHPDTAWLNATEDHRILIEGAGEITTGKLSKKKYLQLGENGYGFALSRICRNLNSLSSEEAASHGLKEFGASGVQVEVSNNFRQYLVVRRDMDLSQEGISANVGPVATNEEYRNLSKKDQKRYFSQTEHDRFVSLLTDKDRTEIINAAFTNKEIVALTTLIMSKINERFPDYAEYKAEQASI